MLPTNSVIGRAWIVFTALVSLFVLMFISEGDYAYVETVLFWAFIGVPLVSYSIYRAVRFIFHGK